MGLSIYLLKHSVTNIFADGQTFAFSEEYWVCFITACLSIFLQMQAPHLAGIVGVQEGAGPAAFVSSIIAAGVTMAKVYGSRGLQRAGGAMVSSSKQGAGYLWNKARGKSGDLTQLPNNLSLDKIREGV